MDFDEEAEPIGIYDLVDGVLVRCFQNEPINGFDSDLQHRSEEDVPIPDDVIPDYNLIPDDDLLTDVECPSDDPEYLPEDDLEERMLEDENEDKDHDGPSQYFQEASLPESSKTEDLVVGAEGKLFKKPNVTKINRKLKRQGKSYKQNRGRGQEIPQRRMELNPCTPAKCLKMHRKCEDFDHEIRKSIFESFWQSGEEARRDFVVAHTMRMDIKRRSTKKEPEASRKQSSVHYFLPLRCRKMRVCRRFFLGTLGVSEKFVRYTEIHQTDIHLGKKDQRGRHVPHNKTPEEQISAVKNFIEIMPAVPSHYCRANTSRKYLMSDIGNLSNLYKIYASHCVENGEHPVSSRVFRDLFHSEYNIGFHKPKKDKCTTCLKNETDAEPSPSYLLHLEEKRDVYTSFQADQKRAAAETPNFVCASFDLEKVLNTPRGESMLLYYSRKLAVYNETFYESGTKRGLCFVWDETQGKRGSNEISSIVFDYLKILDNREGVKEVALYSDSCGGQNRNNTMLFTLYWFINNAATKIESLSITYLLPGHTYMPVDSMHSAIDTAIKGKMVLAPSQWPQIMQNARTNGDPYQVKCLKHDFFRNWTDFSVSIAKLKDSNGQKIKIGKIKKASFQKGSNQIHLTYSYDPQSPTFWVEMPSKTLGPRASRKKSEAEFQTSVTTRNAGKRKKVVEEPSPSSATAPAPQRVSPPQLYETRLPIAPAKYNDLKKLCEQCVIPRKFKEEYLSLPYTGKVVDNLAETDDEDDVTPSDEED